MRSHPTLRAFKQSRCLFWKENKRLQKIQDDEYRNRLLKTCEKDAKKFAQHLDDLWDKDEPIKNDDPDMGNYLSVGFVLLLIVSSLMYILSIIFS